MIRRVMLSVVLVLAFALSLLSSRQEASALTVPYAPYQSGSWVVGYAQSNPGATTQVCLLYSNNGAYGPFYHSGVCSGAYWATTQQVWGSSYPIGTCRWFKTVVTVYPAGGNHYQYVSAPSGCIYRALG